MTTINTKIPTQIALKMALDTDNVTFVTKLMDGSVVYKVVREHITNEVIVNSKGECTFLEGGK